MKNSYYVGLALLAATIIILGILVKNVREKIRTGQDVKIFPFLFDQGWVFPFLVSCAAGALYFFSQ